MTRESIIKRTVQTLNILPVDIADEVADFADFMLRKYEEQIMLSGIERIVEESPAFDFLRNEEDIYTIADIKERY